MHIDTTYKHAYSHLKNEMGSLPVQLQNNCE